MVSMAKTVLRVHSLILKATSSMLSLFQLRKQRYQLVIPYSQYNFSSCTTRPLCSRYQHQRSSSGKSLGEHRVPKTSLLLISRSLSLTSFLGDYPKFIFPVPQGSQDLAGTASRNNRNGLHRATCMPQARFQSLPRVRSAAQL